MRRSLLQVGERILPFLTVLVLSCEGGPSAPEGRVEGQTAFFNGVFVTPVAFHLAWGGSAGIQPAPGFRFYTIEVLYANDTTASRTYDGRAFRLQTEDGRFWDPLHPGRTPILESGTLMRGETVTGWLTFAATGLIWIPRPFVNLTIPIQTEFPM